MADHQERTVRRELERRLRGLPEDVMRDILDLDGDARTDVYLTMRRNILRDFDQVQDAEHKRRRKAQRRARRCGRG